ncbi:putative pentatricopeptide repeat-containing protein, partial [Cucurbita argyrosperma subsp. argyrosperma]
QARDLFCSSRNHLLFFGRARHADRAFQVFDKIPSFGCKRTVISANSLLDAFLRKWWTFFVGIGNYGSPNSCTFNILIHAACLCGDLDAAWDVFDEMPQRGLNPNLKEEMVTNKVVPGMQYGAFGTVLNSLVRGNGMNVAIWTSFVCKESLSEASNNASQLAAVHHQRHGPDEHHKQHKELPLEA